MSNDRETETITAADVATLDAPAQVECEKCEASRASFKPPTKCGHLETCELCSCNPKPEARPVQLPVLADVDVARLALQHPDPRVRSCAKELLDIRTKASGKPMITGHAKTKSPPMKSEPKT